MTDPGWWFHLPLATISAANAHELPFKRARRVKFERRATWTAWMSQHNALRSKTRRWRHWRITLTRFSPGTRQMDSDNLPVALKSVRDELASCLGLDDGDPRITWTYLQARGAYGVLVQLEESDERHAVDGSLSVRSVPAPVADGPGGPGAGEGGRRAIRSAPTG